jgi:methyl-accepting chemotaxis protein
MDWFKNLRVVSKIALSFFLLFLLVFAMGWQTYRTSDGVSNDVVRVLNKDSVFADYAHQMRVEVIQVQQFLTDTSATRAQDGLDDGLGLAKKNYDAFLAHLALFKAKFEKENNQGEVKKTELLKQRFEAYYATGKKMAQAYIDGGPAQGNKMMPAFDAATDHLSAELDPFLQQQTKAMNNELGAVRQSVESLKTNVLIVCSIILVLVFGIGWLLAGSIIRPLKAAMGMIQALEKGNLNERLNMSRQDEFGQMGRSMDAFADNLRDEVLAAFQRLAEGDFTFQATGLIREPLARANQHLNEVMSQLSNAGAQIASGATQVSDSSQSLSQGATEQASSLEEISASMHQLASQTNQNAENATQANQLVRQAKGNAEQGDSRMGQMVAAMEEINGASQEIFKIIKVIDEIAFQTNLLALNAAVEAARAGQHGKGFAVVAEEVRNLAARSAKAAKETAELIEGSVQKAQNGAQIADSTAQALRQIVNEVGKVTDLVAEIAAASNEQAQGISQINQGLTQIDQVTQQNTATAEESAAAAQELSGQAARMKEMLGRFTLAGGGVVASSKTNQPKRASKPATLPTAPSLGWGSQAEASEAPAENPATLIALDDTEFGKY